MRKIGLVIAMESELELIKQYLGTTVKIHDLAGKRVYENEIFGKTLYIAQSYVGEIAGAAATQALIDRYEVDLIVNFGLVGALKEEYGQGRLVVAKSVIHYDFDTSALDGVDVGRYTELNDESIPIDATLASDVSSKYGLKEVIVCSGDKFIADSDKKRWLVSAFSGDVCEMEAAGIALTAYRNGVPSLLIKLISDNADESSLLDFSQFLSRGAQAGGELLADIIKQL